MGLSLYVHKGIDRKPRELFGIGTGFCCWLAGVRLVGRPLVGQQHSQNGPDFSEFHLHLLTLGLVLQAVEGGDDIGVFLMPGLVG